MQISDALDFVKGAVGSGTMEKMLGCVRLAPDGLTATNGKITAFAPLDDAFVDQAIVVDFPKFRAAIGNGSTGKLGKAFLSVATGTLRARIATLDAEHYPAPEPLQGEARPLPGDLVDSMKFLRAFVSDDAVYPWAMGVLLDGKRAYATDNVRVVCRELAGEVGPQICVDRSVIDIVTSEREVPTGVVVEREVWYELRYDSGAWIQASSLHDGWPGIVPQLIDDCNPTAPVPTDLADRLVKLRPLTVDTKYPIVTFTEHGMEVGEGEHSGAVDEAYKEGSGAFFIDRLAPIIAHADKADWGERALMLSGDKFKAVVSQRRG